MHVTVVYTNTKENVRKRKTCGVNNCTRFHNDLLHKGESNADSSKLNCVEIKSTGAFLKMIPV